MVKLNQTWKFTKKKLEIGSNDLMKNSWNDFEIPKNDRKIFDY